MYDEVVKEGISLTADEQDLLEELLLLRLSECVSVGEETTIQELLNKIR